MSTAKAMAAEADLHKSTFSRFDCRHQGVARQGKETTSKEGRLLMTTALAHVQRHVRHYNMQQLSSATFHFVLRNRTSDRDLT